VLSTAISIRFVTVTHTVFARKALACEALTAITILPNLAGATLWIFGASGAVDAKWRACQATSINARLQLTFFAIFTRLWR
jgi:hypothetical protein